MHLRNLLRRPRVKQALLESKRLFDLAESNLFGYRALLRQFLEQQQKQQLQLERLQTMTALNSQSLKVLAIQQASIPLPASAAKPLVSVIIPTWNRSDVLGVALRSVIGQTYANWEAIVVDDGSEDGTEAMLAPLQTDARIRCFQREHQGAGAARNFGLGQARGELIAYLDSDNAWLPNYLETIVAAFAQSPDLQSVYTAQLVEHLTEGHAFIRGHEYDRERMRRENFIDLNIFSHRRALSERLGGFDEGMDRLVDWDFIARCTETDETRYIPIIGCHYFQGRADQITATRNLEHNRYLVQSRLRPAAKGSHEPLKVLYALWHYPQLSESYVRTEIIAACKLGVEVEVWAEEAGVAPFESETPVHYGRLGEVIERFQPDLIHTHWLHYGEIYGAQAEAAGLPVTVRGHGFEFNADITARLCGAKYVAGVYLFPHLLGELGARSDKLKAVPVAFNPDLYFPRPAKDHRLVMRTACALNTKELDTYMRVARMCPDHRFLLVLSCGHKVEHILDEMIALNRKMGSPVDIRINVQHEELAELMGQAAIYLHTTGTEQPFGMPMSIAEAMASGCYIIGRNRPGSSAYIGEAGRLYDTADQAAALVHETQRWCDRQWQGVFVKSVDRAYANFVSDRVIEPIVADWRRITGKR
jgi:glycosyltransferase involved in cell wall biosynthesis